LSQAGSATERATIVAHSPDALRDYFLRLGAAATVLESGEVHVELPAHGPDETIDDYLRAWVAANGDTAPVDPAPSRPAKAAQSPEPFFLDRPRLGDLLLRRGLLTQLQLRSALNESRTENELLGRVLIRRRFIFDDELARTLADQLDLPYVNLRVTSFDRSVAAMIPSREGMRIAALPIGVLGGRIRVAFADPTDEEAKEVARRYVGDFHLTVGELSEIELAWRTLDPTCGLTDG
jgi:type II secretion system (T2SS) protein E